MYVFITVDQRVCFYIFKSTFEKIELILMHYVLKSISLKRDIAILTIFLGGFPLRAKLRNICWGCVSLGRDFKILSPVFIYRNLFDSSWM